MQMLLADMAVLESPVWQAGGVLALGGVAVLALWFFQQRRRSAAREAHLLERLAVVQEEARQAEVARLAARKEVEAFLHTVSHDLRAPLRATCGFSELLQRRYAAQLDDEGRRYLENVIEASRHLDRMIHDLLAYSRMGRMEVVPQVVDLRGILGQVLQGLKKPIEAAGAEIHLPPSLPLVAGHPVLLEQVFLALFDNALTYRQAWEPPRIILWAIEEGGHVLVHLQDNGIGIDQAYHEQIFELFQRLHHRETYPGTGIGLALVRKAVERMGGAVQVASEPGKGSTFTVRLPRMPAPNHGGIP
jgi:signal transduction histidine kinase